MDKIDLYSAIFKRKSIRRFQPTQLDEITLAKLTKTFDQIQPLFKEIKTELKILPENTVKGLFAVKAPHYLAIYSEEKEGYLTNAGYMLQQLDLHLSANSLGSCWLGVAKPSKEKTVSSELKFVITLAFGKSAEQLHRNEVREFRRLPLDQIRDAVGMDDLLEPARLAPSANNSQRWFFTGAEEKVNVYIGNSLLQNRWGLIDAGIAICHIWIAALHFGKQVEQVKDLETAKKKINGKSYVTSLRIY